MGQKNAGIAYLLWIVGGAFGLHHFYLRRDRQAFIWWCTWGGVCGLGWLRDLFYIPQYVALANEDHECLEILKEKQKRHPLPGWRTARFCGEIIVGTLFGFLAQYAIPDELLAEDSQSLLKYILFFIGPFGTAIGVHIVANIGLEQCSWRAPVIGAYLALPFIWMNPASLTYCGIFSAIGASWKGARWRPLRRDPATRHSLCKRVSRLTVCGFIYLSLWSSMIYFNATITTKEGDEVKVREAIQNFFKSPAWLEMKEIMSQLYDNIQTVGWKKFFEDFIDALDPQGEANALKVLGVDSSATQEQITSAYRKLARQWHPDRHKDAQSKKEAQDKFIQIQQAYETLSEIKTRRAERAKQSRSEF